MASYQYVYHMDGVSKTYPGGKKCFENIRLSFLPEVKLLAERLVKSTAGTLSKLPDFTSIEKNSFLLFEKNKVS